MVTDQRRKVGAFVVVAAFVVVGATACSRASGETTTSAAGQPSQTPTATGAATTPTFTSSYIGYVDLTTGETSATEVIPHNSAIDVSPDGTQIAYSDVGILAIADIDGSNGQVLDGTRGEPTGPQWSPDGSSIVYQDGADLYVVDVGSGKARPITDLGAASATAKLDYLSPTFDPTGETVLFNMPITVGGNRYGLWSVPVNGGGKPKLVRKAATFGDVSPDGKQLAFVEDRGFGDLFVAPTGGGRAQKLATGEIVVPRWSPDGTRIVYNDGSGSVYLVDVKSGERILAVETDHLPAWVDDDTLSLSP